MRERNAGKFLYRFFAASVRQERGYGLTARNFRIGGDSGLISGMLSPVGQKPRYDNQREKSTLANQSGSR